MLLGGSNQASINLGFRVYLEDKFTGPASKIKSAIGGLKSEFGMYQNNLAAASAAATAMGASALMVSRALYQATMEGAQFLFTMQGVLAIAEATTAEFTQLKALAISIGRETIFRPDEVASAMRFMAMAGQNASQIMASSAAAMDLAAATMTQPGGKMGAADILTNFLKAFGLEANQSVLAADMLTFAATNANVSLTDLGNSIRYVAATSRNLNIPIQESVGFLMALGNAGIQSSMAGTALENMYRYLAMSVSDFATKRQIASWATLGVTKQDIMTAEGGFIPLVELLGKIKEGSKGLGAVDLQNAIKEIFGVRGQRAAGTLIRNLEQASGFIDLLHGSELHGTAHRKSMLMMDTLEGQSRRLTAAMDGLKVAFADSFTGKVIRKLLFGVTWLVKLFTKFVNTPVGGFVTTTVVALTTLAGIFLVVKGAILGATLALHRFNVAFSAMKGMGVANLTQAIAVARGRGGGFVAAKGVTAPMPFYMGNMARKKVVPGASAKTGYWNPNTGRMAKAPPGGRFITPASNMQRAAQATSKTGWMVRLSKTLGLRGIGGSLGRIGSVLTGPWGMAIMLGITAIASLIPAMIHALTENTTSLKAKWDNEQVERQKLKGAEVMALLSGREMGDVMKDIRTNLRAAYKRGDITLEQIQELISNNKIDLLYWAFKEGIEVDLNPIINDSDKKSPQIIEESTLN